MTPDGIVDFHVHTSPSILPRRLKDPELAQAALGAGVSRYVLKAHEGSTAERAALLGSAAAGGVVLNSPVGGCNPDAVQVAARLGGRVVWLPTVSAANHQEAASSEQLAVHRGVQFRQVSVLDGGRPTAELRDVLDVVAEHDLILASGHVPVPDVVTLFRAAAAHGARRFLINHPAFEFMQWADELLDPLQALGVHLEVGCVADLDSSPQMSTTAHLASRYPVELLVFGSDLGHTAFPSYDEGIHAWYEGLAPVIGESTLHAIMATNGRRLLQP